MFHIYEGRLRECKWASSSPRNLFLTGAGESKFAAHGTEETAHEICNSNAGSVCFFTLGLWFFLKKIRAKKPGCSFFCSISRTVSTPNSSVAHLQDLLKTKKEKKSRNFLKKKRKRSAYPASYMFLLHASGMGSVALFMSSMCSTIAARLSRIIRVCLVVLMNEVVYSCLFAITLIWQL